VSANSRLTIAIHILSSLVAVENKRPDPVTSEQLASSVATNPVVIRRMLGHLRRAGIVVSRRGANAGWNLARSADAITLLDVYQAVEGKALFAMHSSPPNPNCRVARGLKPALGRIYGGLEAQMKRELARTTIAQVLPEA
jgi:Rrf2 family protein